MDLIVAWFVDSKKGAGLSHVVEKEERKSKCGLLQPIGSLLKPSSSDIEPRNIQCMKCRNWLLKRPDFYFTGARS